VDFIGSATVSLFMAPKDIQHVGEELAILWDDGHETFLKLEELRRRCPCAVCAGETDILGHVHKGPPTKLTPASFQLARIEPVGGYAIQPVWADGHQSGIFAFGYLRGLCRCDPCVKSREEA